MVSYNQTQLVYSASLEGDNYIDVTRGLSLLNAKNCSQFTSKDKPISVLMSVVPTSADTTITGASSSWVVRNACVKAVAAWRRTLRSAGIRKKKQLNTYARNPRFALNFRHSDTWCEFTAGTGSDLIPHGANQAYDTGQYQATGSEVRVVAINLDPAGLTPWGDGGTPVKYRTPAFTQTTFAVPQSGSVDVLDKPVNLLGEADAAYCNVVAEYIDSRINDADVEDTDLDPTPSIDNDFVMMLAPGEEVADDVLDNIDDEGKWRPYDLHSSENEQILIYSSAVVPGQATIIDAPLGLIKWDASAAGDKLIIDVIAISEM